jgi:hypothetical protein
MVSSGMLHRLAFVRTDVSEESIAFMIRVTFYEEIVCDYIISSQRASVANYC